MFLPRLSGDNFLELIRNWRDSWNNQILPELERRKVLPSHGIRIDRRACGTMISAVAASGGGAVTGDSGYDGPFAVTLTDTGKLAVSSGYINRLGLNFTLFPGAEVEARTGFLCICSEPVDKRGNWSTPEAMIKDAPNPCAFPVAQITVEGSGESRQISICQYHVAIAIILYSARCPIANL